MSGPAPGVTSHVTPAAFAALVEDLRAELAAAPLLGRQSLMSGAIRAEAFTGRPWVSATVRLRDAALLSGYAINTLQQYAAPCGKRGQPYAKFPPPSPDSGATCRRWVIADLALWAANRNPRQGLAVLSDEQVADILTRLDAGETWRQAGAHHGVTLHAVRHLTAPDSPRRRRRNRAGRTGFTRYSEAVETLPVKAPVRSTARRAARLAFTVNLVLAHPGVTFREAKDAAAAAGIPMPCPSRILHAARAEATARIIGDIVPRHHSGLASAAEIAEAFEVSRDKVTSAMRRGEIRTERKGRLLLADPERLRFRRTPYSRQTPAAPVDQDHPLAVPLPPASGTSAPNIFRYRLLTDALPPA